MSAEVLSYSAGHRPVCACGWVGQVYPLGHLDTARSVLAAHTTIHTHEGGPHA